MVGRLKILLMLCASMPAVLMAQSMTDPTRPSYAEPAGQDASVPVNRLSSIVRRQGAKPLAVIDGAVVPLGGKVGEAKLVSIRENSVVLEQNGKNEVLELTPGIEKTYNRPQQLPVKAKKPS